MNILYFLFLAIGASLSCFATLLFFGSASINELGIHVVSDVSISLDGQVLNSIDRLELIEVEDSLGYGGNIFIMEFKPEGDFSKEKINIEKLSFYGFAKEGL